MKKIIIFTAYVAASLLLGASAYAGEMPPIPDFPMSFWGVAKVNGTTALAGSVVKAYYGTMLAGQVTVLDGGVYGYTEPVKQKLIVAKGEGIITFKIQGTQINSGRETGGSTAIQYSTFESGKAVNKDLNFTVPVLSSSGGGGGGYTAPVVTPVITAPISAPTTTPAVNPVIVPSSPVISVAPTTTALVLGEKIYRIDELIKITKYGKHSKEAKELQAELMRLGFLPKNFKTTDYYGPITAAAVKKYLASKTSSVAESTTVDVDSLIGKTKFGQKGNDVVALQNELKRLGFFPKFQKATSYYGKITQEAVKKYLASK